MIINLDDIYIYILSLYSQECLLLTEQKVLGMSLKRAKYHWVYFLSFVLSTQRAHLCQTLEWIKIMSFVIFQITKRSSNHSTGIFALRCASARGTAVDGTPRGCRRGNLYLVGSLSIRVPLCSHAPRTALLPALIPTYYLILCAVRLSFMYSEIEMINGLINRKELEPWRQLFYKYLHDERHKLYLQQQTFMLNILESKYLEIENPKSMY